jgi:hypothetical protein
MSDILTTAEHVLDPDAIGDDYDGEPETDDPTDEEA